MKRKLILTVLSVAAVLVTGTGCLRAAEKGLISPSFPLLLDSRTDTLRFSDSELEKLRTTAPPLNGLIVASQIVLGSVAGGMGSVMLGIIGAEHSFTGIVVTMAVGYTLGASYGVYGAGNVGDQAGSYRATLIGTAAGSVLSGLIFASRDDEAYSWEFYSLLLPPAGGAVGFNLTRRHKMPSERGEAAPELPGRHNGTALFPGAAQQSREAAACYFNLIDIKF